jgi:hypothetical protein
VAPLSPNGQNVRLRPQTRLIGKRRSVAALVSTSRPNLKVLGQRIPA